MTRCDECGSDQVADEPKPESFSVGKVHFLAEVRITRCLRCGHVEVSKRARKRIALRAARWLAERGVRTREAFRFMRKAVGLRAVDLAQLLDVQPETLSRWETGKREVTHCAAALLGSLVIEKDRGRRSLVDRLEALRRPARAESATAIRLDGS